MGFIDLVKARARADKKTIVLPESMDRRTWEAAETILKEDIANLIIIGTPEDIADHSKGLDVSGATVINPQTYEKTQEYIDLFVELRKSKGMTPEKAKEIIMSDYAYYGCLMIKNGDADGLVSGACHSTADTLRPCLQIVKTKPGTKLVSAFFLMVVPDCEYGAEGTFIFADSGLNQNPNPEELAAIAKSSADSFELLVQKEARVAMLSHSTKGSAKHPDVDKVVEATRIAKELYPEMICIADICLCEYTDHGHCGVIKDGEVLNDETLELLSKAAVSCAAAGADRLPSARPHAAGRPARGQAQP